MTEQIEEFLGECIKTKLMVNDTIDLFLSSISQDMGIDKGGIADLLLLIEEEYGIETDSLLEDDDTIPILAEKIFQRM